MTLQRMLTVAMTATTVMVALIVCASPADAQIRPRSATPSVEASAAAVQSSTTTPRTRSWLYGVRGGLYSVDNHGFLGGGAALPVAQRFWFDPNAEWLFVSEIDRMFTVNADLLYDLPASGSMLPWVGAGIGIRHFAKGDGWGPEHSLGLNVIGGMGFGQGNGLIPFVQGKVFVAGDTLFANTAELVLCAGVRF